jgi:hypothetical protein
MNHELYAVALRVYGRCKPLSQIGGSPKTISDITCSVSIDPLEAHVLATTRGVDDALTKAMTPFLTSRACNSSGILQFSDTSRSSTTRFSSASINTMIVKSIETAAKAMNGMSFNGPISAQGIINGLQIILLAVLQLALPGPEFLIAEAVAVPAFRLLSLVITDRKQWMGWLRTHCTCCCKRKTSASV